MATIAELFALACQYHQVGNFAQAEQLYRLIIQSVPSHAGAYANLAHVCAAQKKLAEAEDGFRQVTLLHPQDADAHNNLGNAQSEQGKLEEAAVSYRHALALRPSFAAAHYNLGNTLKQQGKLDEAAASYRRALQLKPDYDMSHVNLGNILLAKHDLTQAVRHYELALRLNPRNFQAQTNLGVAKSRLGRLEEAVACHRLALKLCPNHSEVYLNLGAALGEQKKLPEAVACFRRALQINPNYLAALAELVLKMQVMCLWKDLEAFSRKLIQAIENTSPRSVTDAVPPLTMLLLPLSTTPSQQLQCARNWANLRLKNSAIDMYTPSSALHAGHRISDRITVGYLSGDFHEHAVSYLTRELFEKHDRRQFRVFGYSYNSDDRSPVRLCLEKAFDRFSDLRDVCFARAAQSIIADEVDILVDLTGYTGHSRSQIMAHRPAPVQVSFVGYPGTMGASFIDYILVDDFVVPPEQQLNYSERLVHLPGCYLPYDSTRQIASHTPSRAECGLRESGFIFCCFNSSFKITPEMFEVWMRLLKAIPDSVLWLLEFNGFAPKNLREEAKSHGVSAERLIFAPHLPQPLHLARYRLADLFLDTTPYGAHTTAADALWVGCPVLTIVGDAFPSRVAGSLLRTLGLPELITSSFTEYEALALRLAQQPCLLSNLRTRLNVKRTESSLFDGARFARKLEQAYSTMWRTYLAGDAPA
jgi:protein O-GlcNAc transferase